MKKELSLTVRTAVPLVFAQLAFAANTFVTQFFLARHSTIALHASLPGSMLAVTYMVFFNMTLGYAGTIFAQRHGGGDVKGALTTFVQSVWLTLFALPLLALGLPIARLILGVFNTDPEVLAAETRYFDILMLNAAFTILAQVLGGFFTGQGKTRFIGLVTVLGFAVNMAIAPFFIAGALGLPGGITGAGIAQTIAHVVPCVVLAGAIVCSPEFRNRTVSLKPDLSARETLEILKLGIPNGIRTVLEIGGFFVFTAFLAECPKAAVAASTAVFAVNNIPYGCIQGLSSAVEILVGRASGKKDANAVRGFLVTSTLLTVLVATVYVAILWVFQNGLLDPFLKDPEISLDAFHETTRLLVGIVAVKTLFEMMTLVLQGTLRGIGETAAICRVQAISSFLVWIPAYCTVRAFHPTVPAFWTTMVLAGVASCALLGQECRRITRRRVRRRATCRAKSGRS